MWKIGFLTLKMLSEDDDHLLIVRHLFIKHRSAMVRVNVQNHKSTGLLDALLYIPALVFAQY